MQLLAAFPSVHNQLPESSGSLGPERGRYRIRLLGNRIRMEAGGSTMIGVVDGEDELASWSTIDPRTNRVLETGGTFNRGLAVQNTRSLMFPGLGEAQLRILSSSVTPTGDYRTIAGHETRRYRYQQDLFLPLPQSLEVEGVPGLNVSLNGEAWIVVNGPFEADRRVENLFRQHAWSMAARSYGHDSELQQLRELGMIFQADETTTVGIAAPGGAPETIMTGSETMTVTSIEAVEVDPAIFEPLEQASQGCDCSCRAFTRLQEIGDMPHDQQEAQPDAMALSMCAPRCAMQWMRCGNGVGGSD